MAISKSTPTKPAPKTLGQNGQGAMANVNEVSIGSTRSENAVAVYKGAKSTLAMIIGKSGQGKSTAIENLPPERTHLISVMGKDLPFMTAVRYIEGVNHTVSADPTRIRKVMKEVSNNEEIDYLVIDDNQYIMATEFMDKAMVKGYDKFTMMARNMFDILVLGTKLRSGLKIFILTHEEDDGRVRKMKTLGKMLDEKITCEGLATIVMFAEVDSKTDGKEYYFATQSDGQTTAKSPRGMFPSRIPNCLKRVGDRIDEYYSAIPLEKSKIDFTVKPVK